MASTYRTSTNLSAEGIAQLVGITNAKAGTLSGDSDIVDETQDILTSSTSVTLGQIDTGDAALVELVNLDTAHFVSFGFETPCVAGTKTFKLSAGQSMLLANPSGDIYAIADTATVKILKRAVEV